MKKTISVLLIIIVLLSSIGCGEFDTFNSSTSTTTPVTSTSTASQNKTPSQITDNTTTVPSYEKVSRPIKDFWFVQKKLLVLTEEGDVLFGSHNSNNPILITKNAKDIKMSEDNYDGAILLNDGKILPINDRYETKTALSFFNIDENNPKLNIEKAIRDVNARELFNHYLFVGETGYLYDINGNLVLDKEIRSGHVCSYRNNIEKKFSAVFLLKDGTVIHYCSTYGKKEIKTLATNVVHLSFDEHINSYSLPSVWCGAVTKNGDLICWKIDHSGEIDPNEIQRIATDANTNSPIAVTQTATDRYVIYINKNNQIIRWDGNTFEYKVLDSNAKTFFSDLDLRSLSYAFGTPGADVFLTRYGELKRTASNIIITKNVNRITDDGRFIIDYQGKCFRFDGDSGYFYRADNVQNVKTNNTFERAAEIHVFLKHGGALYASDTPNGSVYKTAFCEKNITLLFDNQKYTPRQNLQIISDTPMLPYDECANLFETLAYIDRNNNSVTLQKDSTTIVFHINTYNVSINGSSKTINVKTYTDSNNKTWIPINIIAEELGYTYNYDLQESTININK